MVIYVSDRCYNNVESSKGDWKERISSDWTSKFSKKGGELVTNVGIIGARGRALPLIRVFPRIQFDEKKIMRGMPSNTSLGLVHKSGWMTALNFLEALRFLC